MDSYCQPARSQRIGPTS